MVADPYLLKAGSWLAIAGGVLLVLTVLAFVLGWGVRFRLVGVSSFTLLLAAGCGAFAISYSPRSSIEGALVVPVVFDNGSNLVVASAPADFPLRQPAPALSRWPAICAAADATAAMAWCMCGCVSCRPRAMAAASPPCWRKPPKTFAAARWSWSHLRRVGPRTDTVKAPKVFSDD